MNQMAFSVMVTIAALFAAAPTQAQEWAQARLNNSPRHHEWVKVKQGDRELSCFVAYPEVKEKVTAVLLIHEIYGLSDWMRGMADQFAEAGYIAIAPDLLSGLGKDGGGTSEMGGNDKVTKAVSSLPPDQVTADLNAVADYVKKLPSCNGKLVIGGFCWGGGQTFRYATSNKDMQAGLVFYGPPPSPEALSKISAPVYGFYGGNDNRITSTVESTREQMKAAGKIFDAVVYEGAGHGFMRAGEAPDASAANKKARAEAWTRIKDLLKKV